MARWGFFISLEGIEGSGKSTLARTLELKLKELGFDVVLTREPGGTPVGERIRDVLLHHSIEMEPWTEAFLMLAARYENTRKVILPALQNGKIVISDRYDDSTMAYQGFARGLPLKPLARLNKFATLGLKPNLTFLIDLPANEGLSRKSTEESNRFEEETVKFHEKVREGYLKLARRAKKRIVVLDGTKPPDELAEIAFFTALKRLKEKGKYKEEIPNTR